MQKSTRGFLNDVRGFTIVELLIVIVVIAILAAISIVAYTGIQNRAAETVLQSDLRNSATQLALLRTEQGDAYPTLDSTASSLKKSQGTSYQYTTDGDTYCLTATSSRSGVPAYYVSSTSGAVAEGACDGHTGGSGETGSNFPTRGGFTDLTFSYAANNVMRVPIGSIPNNSWMVVVLAHAVGGGPTPPAGWTTLANVRESGTLRTSIYAKIKQSGDSDNQDFSVMSHPTTNAAIVWGAGAAPIGNWTLGSFGDRGSNGTPTTAVAPSVTTTAANSLVVSIAAERTAADESNYTSMSGATPWGWVPHPTGNSYKMQTIAIGYTEQASIGATSPVTVTYPNPQSINATAVQLAIPPA